MDRHSSDPSNTFTNELDQHARQRERRHNVAYAQQQFTQSSSYSDHQPQPSHSHHHLTNHNNHQPWHSSQHHDEETTHQHHSPHFDPSQQPHVALRRTTSSHRVPLPNTAAKAVKQLVAHKRSSSVDRSGQHHASARTQGQWARAAAQQQYRQRGRFVQLPPHLGGVSDEVEEEAVLPAEGQRGRITVFTVCDAFERNAVAKAIKLRYPNSTCSDSGEVILINGLPSYQPGLSSADLFVFDYGVLVCWGLSAAQELSILRLLRPCEMKPLKTEDIHKEELGFQYTSDQPPNIQNDVITISRLRALDQQVKLAISHALAQSSKLSVYETRVAELVEQVRHLPESMMEHGEIKMTRKQMACLMGRVFIQKSEVNLLSSVLDTPEFFWRAPDALQALYGTVGDYLELEDRAQLVNSRTVLIQSMLNMWSDHASHNHIARLDRIIIVLIIVEVVIAFAEIVGFFNY